MYSLCQKVVCLVQVMACPSFVVVLHAKVGLLSVQEKIGKSLATTSVWHEAHHWFSWKNVYSFPKYVRTPSYPVWQCLFYFLCAQRESQKSTKKSYVAWFVMQRLNRRFFFSLFFKTLMGSGVNDPIVGCTIGCTVCAIGSFVRFHRVRCHFFWQPLKPRRAACFFLNKLIVLPSTSCRLAYVFKSTNCGGQKDENVLRRISKNPINSLKEPKRTEPHLSKRVSSIFCHHPNRYSSGHPAILHPMLLSVKGKDEIRLKVDIETLSAKTNDTLSMCSMTSAELKSLSFTVKSVLISVQIE